MVSYLFVRPARTRFIVPYPGPMVRLACSTASFPADRLPIAIAKVGWAGYTEAELVLTGSELPSVEEVRTRMAANELAMAAIRAGSLPPEGGEAGLERLAEIGRAAQFARALDCPLVVVQAPAEGDRSGLSRALGMLDAALRGMAADVCLVNAPHTLIATPADLSELWAAGLPERVHVALDPGRALLAGWDPANLDSLPELPRYVYLNDAQGDRIVPPGEGDLDPPRLAAALRERGYGESVCLLLQNADPWAVDPIARELRVEAEAWFG